MNQHSLEYGPCYTCVQGRLFVTIEVPQPLSYYPSSTFSIPLPMLPTQFPAGAWQPLSILEVAAATSAPMTPTPAATEVVLLNLPLTGPEEFISLGSDDFAGDVFGDWPFTDTPTAAGYTSPPSFCESPPTLSLPSSTPSETGSSSQGQSNATTSESASAATPPLPLPPALRPIRTLNNFSWASVATVPTPNPQNATCRARLSTG